MSTLTNNSNMEHHPDFPPSSLPALSKCPCYKSKPAGEAAERGSRLHKQMEDILCSKELSEAVIALDVKTLSVNKRGGD